MRRFLVVLGATALFLTAAPPVSAAPIVIDALLNSSGGAGIDLDTGIDITAGQRLIVNVALNDCWAAGVADRTTNASGLDALVANPCRPAPVSNFGLHSQDGESFPFASLVGRIGPNDWFFIGTNFNAVVPDSGRLFLVFWDSNSADNVGFITADVTVPGPAPFVVTGLGLLATLIRRRSRR